MKYDLPDVLFLKLDYEIQQYVNEDAYDIINTVLLDTVDDGAPYEAELHEELESLAKFYTHKDLLLRYFNYLLRINTQDDDDL